MSIKNFWPENDQDHAHSCLFTEAETAADAVFLAVHQPMRLYRESVGGSQGSVSKTENDLLTALLKKDPASGTLIIPIVGNSGVGKSHMVRWLDAHLRLKKDADQRHIVRIPKSSSLKKVLELVLDGLPNDKYGDIKQQMLSAKLPPTRLQATLGLKAGLLYELEMIGKAAQNRIADGKEQPGDRMRKAHCSTRGLLSLLNDPEIHNHFGAHEGDKVEEWGVLTRIADRCLNGSLKNDKGELNQFLESDFDFIQGTSLDLANLSRETRGYVSGLRARPEMLQQAINCLKEAREPAVASLVTFQSSLTLSELFVSIRECLYHEGKELILLVEDFAVLAGVQGALLDAIVREAVRDGVQELCTMRTALAVTEGQLPETVLTRGQFVWKIDDQPFASEEEALSVFERFVGSYLNAARFGRVALEKAYENRKNLTSWIPKYEDEQDGLLDEDDQLTLNAFGFAPNGHSLFPLNKGCIRQIARKHLYSAQKNTYKFDPRKLINKVLRETVIDNWELYTEGEFPSPNFSEHSGMELHPDVLMVINREFPLNAHSRLNTLLYFWGNDPKSREEMTLLPRNVYTAFDLPELQDSPVEPPIIEEKKRIRDERNVEPIIEKREVQVKTENLPPITWDARLEEWRRDNSINQTAANAIRRAIAEAVEVWLDSSSMFVYKLKLDQTKIYLPSTGQGIQSSDGAVIEACKDSDFRDNKKSARFIQIVRAMMRYDECKNWDYDGGELDSIQYASFISEMADQARDWYMTNGAGVPREALGSITQALLIGAGILNIKGGSKKDTLEENLAALLAFGESNVNQFEEAMTPWDKLTNLAFSVREELREKLMVLVGARQGTGGELAVDASLLLESVEELRGRGWSLPDDLDLSVFGNFTSLVKQYIHKIREKDLTRVIDASLLEKEKWLGLVEDSIGSTFDREKAKGIFQATIEAAKKASVFRWHGGEARTLLKRSKDLGPVRETYNLVNIAVDEESDVGTKLGALSKIDNGIMSELGDFLRDYNAFLSESSEVAVTQLQDVSESPKEVAEALDRDFQKMASIWTAIAGKDAASDGDDSISVDQLALGECDDVDLSSDQGGESEEAKSLVESEKLIVMSERIEHLNSERQITDQLNTVSDTLSEYTDTCIPLQVTLNVLISTSVSTGVLVDKAELKSVLDKTKNLRGRLTKDPSTLTHRNTWAQCQQSIKKLRGSLKTQLVSQWGTFVDTESPSTGQTSIFGGLPAHKKDYDELMRLSGQLDVIRERLPEDSGVVETVRMCGLRMRELIAGMSIDGEPEEMVNFLKRCQQGGVPLNELTLQTQEWLTEKGFSQDLVIKVK